MLVRQSHEMIDRQWCWAEFDERSGVGRNRTVVDAVVDAIERMKASDEAEDTVHLGLLPGFWDMRTDKQTDEEIDI